MEPSERKLTPYFSGRAAWAFSLGTSIGWGSLVITSNTYLSQAGPAGSVIGLLLGAVVMLIVARNYSYMINCHPEAGGAYTYLKESFGYDYGFLTAWFLILTYLAMLWANATALPIFARYFIGDYFQIIHIYTIFGYDVYLGEALVSVVALLVTALICSNMKRITSAVMVIMAVIFTAGIVLVFAASITHHTPGALSPAYIPDEKALGQIIKIACISSWAFIGFENISHSVEEFTFKRDGVFKIFTISVITSTLLYVFITLMSVTAFPSRYDTWLDYIRDTGNLSGLEALPAFYVANVYLGRKGVMILIISLLMLVLTSLVGNTVAMSRLFYSMARDGIIPKRYSALNHHDIPGNAVMLTAIISSIIPFVGRTAIGWIVDVTTLGATLIYGFVSAAVYKTAVFRNDKTEKVTGMTGMLIMIAFALYLLVPNLFTKGSIETESYFLFVVWSVLGFIFFRTILMRDTEKRFGQSIIVWIALLSLILFISLVWMSRSTREAAETAMNHIQNYYEEVGAAADESQFVASEIANINRTTTRCVAVVIGVVALSLGVLLNNYSIMSRRARASEKELGAVKDMAARDPLTGVKSKHAYAEKVRSINESIASGQIEPFAVAVCDINGLKIINDTLGHKAGDEYIKSAARLICELFDHSPVYRIGGDEFVAILTGRDYENRENIMQRLHDTAVARINTDEVVVSGGLSDYNQDKEYHFVFERADGLMYEEKKSLKAMGAETRL